jgi:hypothetical protein
MAQHKCNFIIFSKYNGNETKKLNLKLFNAKLNPTDNPTFLGIRFDKYLSFKNQISYLHDAVKFSENLLKKKIWIEYGNFRTAV